jgi:hypothetical protein
MLTYADVGSEGAVSVLVNELMLLTYADVC